MLRRVWPINSVAGFADRIAHAICRGYDGTSVKQISGLLASQSRGNQADVWRTQRFFHPRRNQIGQRVGGLASALGQSNDLD